MDLTLENLGKDWEFFTGTTQGYLRQIEDTREYFFRNSDYLFKALNGESNLFSRGENLIVRAYVLGIDVAEIDEVTALYGRGQEPFYIINGFSVINERAEYDIGLELSKGQTRLIKAFLVDGKRKALGAKKRIEDLLEQN